MSSSASKRFAGVSIVDSGGLSGGGGVGLSGGSRGGSIRASFSSRVAAIQRQGSEQQQTNASMDNINNAAAVVGSSSSNNTRRAFLLDDADDAIYRIDRDVLVSIAHSTPLDAGLQRMVTQRPLVAELLADQVVWLIATTDKMRHMSRVPKHARPATTAGIDDHDVMPKHAAASPALHQISIVLIGCGFVGSRVAERLLESKAIHPSSLHIMTRQPETLSKFAKVGVICGTLKADAIAAADVVVIATLPGQLSTVSRTIKGHLKASAVVVSLCAGVPVEKACAECQHPLCITTSVDTRGAAAVAGGMAGGGIHSSNIRRHCEAQLLRYILPASSSATMSGALTSAYTVPSTSVAADDDDGDEAGGNGQLTVVDEGALVTTTAAEEDASSSSSSSYVAVEWISRVAFVLASAGTAMGLPFHFSTFAAYSYMASEPCRLKYFKLGVKDHMCPGPSDAQRIQFSHLLTFIESVGMVDAIATEKEVHATTALFVANKDNAKDVRGGNSNNSGTVRVGHEGNSSDQKRAALALVAEERLVDAIRCKMISMLSMF